jgi:hypothetical protein
MEVELFIAFQKAIKAGAYSPTAAAFGSFLEPKAAGVTPKGRCFLLDLAKFLKIIGL